jgi:O-acetyl-ADP-ribose deacetylase
MLSIRIQDILTADADILVLSANPSLLAGSGISGVIHKAEGPKLEAAAKPFAPIEPGQSIITPAFNLPAKYIIHTVCPRYMDGQRGENEQLYKAYASALAFHDRTPEAKSIAFASMGTGVYKWPPHLAAAIAIDALTKSKFELTLMCILDSVLLETYTQIRCELHSG